MFIWFLYIFIMLYHTDCIQTWSVWTPGFEKTTIFDASNPVSWSLILTSASLIQDLNLHDSDFLSAGNNLWPLDISSMMIFPGPVSSSAMTMSANAVQKAKRRSNLKRSKAVTPDTRHLWIVGVQQVLPWNIQNESSVRLFELMFGNVFTNWSPVILEIKLGPLGASMILTWSL